MEDLRNLERVTIELQEIEIEDGDGVVERRPGAGGAD